MASPGRTTGSPTPAPSGRTATGPRWSSRQISRSLCRQRSPQCVWRPSLGTGLGRPHRATWKWRPQPSHILKKQNDCWLATCEERMGNNAYVCKRRKDSYLAPWLCSDLVYSHRIPRKTPLPPSSAVGPRCRGNPSGTSCPFGGQVCADNLERRPLQISWALFTEHWTWEPCSLQSLVLHSYNQRAQYMYFTFVVYGLQ